MNFTNITVTVNTTVASTRNNSNTSDISSAEYYIEDYSLWIKICFAILGIVTFVTSSISCTAMYRTRKVPHAAKFLAMCLLFSDAGFVIFSTIRKFVLNPFINTNLMVCAAVFVQMSYVTIGLMSFERYFVFNWPIKYLRYCSVRMVRRVAITVWTLCILTFLALRYIVCYIQNGERMLYMAGTCLMLVTVYYSGIVFVVVCVSFTCYYKIFNTIRTITSNDKRKLSFQSTAKVLRSYKSTSLVLVYFVVILTTSVSYIMILVNVRYFNLDSDILRITFEFVNILNCVLDPYLYVLWFDETKMECLKLLAPFSERLQAKVEQMRTKIFDIVPNDFITTRSSKVSPQRY